MNTGRSLIERTATAIHTADRSDPRAWDELPTRRREAIRRQARAALHVVIEDAETVSQILSVQPHVIGLYARRLREATDGHGWRGRMRDDDENVRRAG